MIDRETLSALQIIQPESHPNVFNQGPGASGAKESLSVFGLFHLNARTPQGKARLRQYFLRPSVDLAEIQARLDFVAVFCRTDNHAIAQQLSKSLSRIKNIRTIMTFLHKGISGGNMKNRGGFKSGVWASLLEFCYHTLDIVNTLTEVLGVGGLGLRVRILETFDPFQIRRIGQMINTTVDLDLSVAQQRTVIRYGVNEELDKVKEVYDGMEDLLGRAAHHVAATLPNDVILVEPLAVVFNPQLGFHLTVPVGGPNMEPVFTGPGWERRFTTGQKVYFKDATTIELDDTFGDIFANVCDREIEIAYELAQKVLMDEKMLIDVSDLCGELDSLLALAHGAIQHKLVKPKVVEESVVGIKCGRHPLQEMTVDSFVPNDAVLHESDKMMILTGPNYSGKSVYLKQVALAVVMAHVGSFVAAESATIGLTDRILTRIATKETVTKMQSAFMIDLQQIAQIISHCSPRSLVVVDEFGKGTDSADGAGLAAGVFQHFIDLGSDSPTVLAATHYHEIFEQGYIEPGTQAQFAHMEVIVDGDSRGKEVTYLYNLKSGRSTLSYGVQCAAMSGVPIEVVQRAAELGDVMARGGDLVSLLAVTSPNETEELEEAQAVARAFLAADFARIDCDLQATLADILQEEVFQRADAMPFDLPHL